MSLSCIMVVDDCEPDQFICKMMIEKYNPDTTVLQAFDGVEALEVLDRAKQQPCVIFLDINMPRMNGHEFLKAYSKRQYASASIVVMLTSSDQKEDQEKCRAYDCVKSYLKKPLDVDGLQDIENIMLQE